MYKKEKNYAFIDSQNVNLAIRDLGWKLDFSKFNIYLKEKYSVHRAYIFIGYVEENKKLYEFLKEKGYFLIFKETIKDRDGLVKGNVDAELVLQAMIDYNEYNKAILVSGDGDFGCLIKYLNMNNKLEKVLVPNMFRYSRLIKKTADNKIDFMNNLKNRLRYEKNLIRTEP